MFMIETRFLSNKMKISFDHEELRAFSHNQVRFYQKYSSFVFKSLKKASFQKFLNWMLRKEQIDKQAIRVVHVKVLPLRSKNGKGIAGNCDVTRGRIRIYPKTSKFCQLFRQKFGRNFMLIYARNRARAALIHELLHLKYIEDEKTVRELAQEYFGIFAQRQDTKSTHLFCIHKLIFNSRIWGETATPTISSESATKLKLN
jgi:hypothetical protein